MFLEINLKIKWFLILEMFQIVQVLIKFFDKLEDRMGVAEKGIEFNLSYSDVG